MSHQWGAQLVHRQKLTNSAVRRAKGARRNSLGGGTAVLVMVTVVMVTIELVPQANLLQVALKGLSARPRVMQPDGLELSLCEGRRHVRGGREKKREENRRHMRGGREKKREKRREEKRREERRRGEEGKPQYVLQRR